MTSTEFRDKLNHCYEAGLNADEIYMEYINHLEGVIVNGQQPNLETE